MRHRTLLAATLASCIFACGPGEDADPDSGAVDALADGSGDVGETDADATGEEVDVAEPIDPVEAVLSVAETGRWTVPGLQGDVHVLRTEGDVPHIYASTEHEIGRASCRERV